MAICVDYCWPTARRWYASRQKSRAHVTRSRCSVARISYSYLQIGRAPQEETTHVPQPYRYTDDEPWTLRPCYSGIPS
eukprot:scaffold41578_cov18-Prasinocladus_malaysianus.AAC.1